MENSSTPSWWAHATMPRYASDEDRTQDKVYACRLVLGYLLNLPSSSDEAARVRGWLSPEDFPGVLHIIADRLWNQPYDGDPHTFVLQMLRDGYGARIGSGVLITDLYWNASLASIEEAAFIVRGVRQQEAAVAAAWAALERL